jgi:hypothetical protein
MEWKDIRGWLNGEEAEVLQRLTKDKVVIEVGSYFGRSTVCIADVARRVYSIDTHKALGDGQTQFSSRTTWDEFKSNIKGYTNIFPFVGESSYWLEIMPKADVVFIDGMHKFLTVKSEILLLRNKVDLFIFHDYNLPQVKLAVESMIDIEGSIRTMAWGRIKPTWSLKVSMN